MIQERQGLKRDAASGREAQDMAAPSVAEPPQAESRASVIAAILGNIAVGIVKFIAAALSGSSAMLSEGVHSIVDSGNGILILFGMKRAARDADGSHPFGYGKELYFWTLVVAVLIFALGGGISIMEGIKSLMAVVPGETMGDPTMSYIVIVLSALIEGMSLSVAIRQFNAARGTLSPIRFIKEAKDPSMYTVVLEDTAAELGLIFAFCGIFLGHILNNPYLDGGASVLIGALLCGVSIILLKETKGLLIGEGMTHPELEEVQQLVEGDAAVLTCGRILSMYLGPTDLLLTLDVTFRPAVSSTEVLMAIDRIEASIRERFPQTTRVFIEAESLRQTQEQRRAFEAQGDA
jgi:cation diffusion facilitator family transporter